MNAALASKAAKQKTAEQGYGRVDSHDQGSVLAGVHGDVLDLQRSVGNRAVNQVLKSGTPSPGPIQGKLTVSQPGDKYEQEADQVAEQVMRMPDSEVGTKTPSVTPVQTQSVQRDASSGQAPTVTPSVQDKIEGLQRSGGEPLSEGVREFMEPRLGTDFRDVRIHNNQCSNTIAMNLNARALSVGRNIFFRSDSLDLKTSSGLKILAHELTHVVQQSQNSQSSSTASQQVVQLLGNGGRAQQTVNEKPAGNVAWRGKVRDSLMPVVEAFTKEEHEVNHILNKVIKGGVWVYESKVVSLSEFEKLMNVNGEKAFPLSKSIFDIIANEVGVSEEELKTIVEAQNIFGSAEILLQLPTLQKPQEQGREDILQETSPTGNARAPQPGGKAKQSVPKPASPPLQRPEALKRGKEDKIDDDTSEEELEESNTDGGAKSLVPEPPSSTTALKAPQGTTISQRPQKNSLIPITVTQPQDKNRAFVRIRGIPGESDDRAAEIKFAGESRIQLRRIAREKAKRSFINKFAGRLSGPELEILFDALPLRTKLPTMRQLRKGDTISIFFDVGKTETLLIEMGVLTEREQEASTLLSFQFATAEDKMLGEVGSEVVGAVFGGVSTGARKLGKRALKRNLRRKARKAGRDLKGKFTGKGPRPGKAFEKKVFKKIRKTHKHAADQIKVCANKIFSRACINVDVIAAKNTTALRKGKIDLFEAKDFTPKGRIRQKNAIDAIEKHGGIVKSDKSKIFPRGTIVKKTRVRVVTPDDIDTL